METVLLTGASGVLGREVVARLDTEVYNVRLMRHRKASAPSAGMETVSADLVTGEGLTEAVRGVDVILHLASDPRSPHSDIESTARLLELAKAAHVRRFIFQSIVGIEFIPYNYYKVKVAVEKLVRESGLEWTIFRATQFHQLLDTLLTTLDRWPVLFVPRRFQFQPVDPGEVAAHLIEALSEGTTGYTTELGGPQILSLGEMAQTWQSVRGRHKPILNLPIPSKTATGFRRGYNNTDQATGQLDWQTWLKRRYQVGESGLIAQP